ncbi:hypothetical protein DFS34DRAFT_695952 [Phlyctochytrium arcticum]|nr:hypothetical protein DFS34DRAFT_695952 [Phlyctochytrium arcticum]
MKVSSHVSIALATIGLASTATANVWYALNAYQGSSCQGAPFKFVQIDMTRIFNIAQLGTVFNSTDFQTLAKALGVKDIPTKMYTCTDLTNLGVLLTSLSTLSGSGQTSTNFLNLGASVSATLPAASHFGDLIAGKCVTEKEGTMTYAMDAKCQETRSGRDPAFPPGKSPYVTYYAGFGQTSCAPEKATLISAQLADGMCYSNNILSTNSTSIGSCSTAGCGGNMTTTPNITMTSATGVSLGALPAGFANCKVNTTNYSTAQYKCVAGSSKSLVSGQETYSYTFASNSNQVIPFAGAMGLKLASSNSVNVNVTVGPAPEVANAPPSNGINTFYHFKVPSNTQFSAVISLTYDDDLLNQFQYKAKDLKWAVYNETAMEWQIKSDTKVNTDTKQVEFTTSGFSEWTVVYKPSAALRSAATPLVILLGLAVSLSAYV